MNFVQLSTYILFLTCMFLPITSQATPCDASVVPLAPTDEVALKSIIAKQLNTISPSGNPETAPIDILNHFQTENWQIFYVAPYNADESFVFYNRDPQTSPYVTVWSGAARIDEEREIKQWIVKNAKGIPDPLATCFAWYVTKGR